MATKKTTIWWDADNDPQHPGWCITTSRPLPQGWDELIDHDILTTPEGDDLPEDADDETLMAAARRYSPSLATDGRTVQIER